MAGRVTHANRVQAERQALRTKAVEDVLATLAQRVAFQVGRDSIKELKRTGGVSKETIAKPLVAAQKEMTQSLVVSYLKGVEVGFQNSSAELATVSSIFKATVASLIRRQVLEQADIDGLVERYGAIAADVIALQGDEISDRIQATVFQLVSEGAHVREGVATLAAEMAGATAFQIETVYRTQTMMAYGAGQWDSYQNPVVDEILWGYKYVTVGDNRVRPTHAALEGMTAPKDGMIWDTLWPPNGFNCRCQAIPLYTDHTISVPPADDLAAGADEGFEFNAGQVLGPTETGLPVGAIPQ